MQLRQTLLKISLLLFLSGNFNIAHTQTTNNSLDVVPHWKKDDTHLIKINVTTDDGNSDNVKSTTYISSFDARFQVTDFSDSGYIVEWVYTGVKLADNDPVLENQILAKLINQKLIVRFSKVGKFIDIENANNVKPATDKAIDDLVASTLSNPPLNMQYKAAKQIITSEQGLEAVILKHIKAYDLSFGYNYKLNYIQTNKMKFPNPLGGQPFDAVEKVQLTKLDSNTSTCVIETNKVIDGAAVKASVVDYLKKVSNADAETIDEEVAKVNLEISESTIHEINYVKGIVQHSTFKRTMNLGFQNRTTIIETELIS